MNETGDAKKNLFKVLSLLEACFDLISGSTLSMKSQIMGGKITEILEFKSPLWKVKIFSFFFLFIFKFFTQKWISFINIWFVKQGIPKWLKTKICSFLLENLKMKRKKDKTILTFQIGDLNPRFSVIFRSWFEFSCDVRSPRLNQNKLLKEIEHYFKKISKMNCTPCNVLVSSV